MPVTFRDPAAVLPGEAVMLAAVTAAPADDTPRLVYADWLDDHADPRAAFLRAFVAALRDGSALPDPAGVSAGWREVVGYNLVAEHRRVGMGGHVAAALRLAVPAVAIDRELWPDKDLPVGGSKFGGLPDLPAGADWPWTGEGKFYDPTPLQFLAQFDLADVARTAAGRALPAAGLLSFFQFHDGPDDEFGTGRGAPTDGPVDMPGGLQVVFTPPGVELARLDPPDELTDDLGRPRAAARLVFAEALDYPYVDTYPGSAEWDPWQARYGEEYTAALQERYAADIRYEHRLPESEPIRQADHQLFGYSHLSVLACDPTPGPDWVQLLGFRSDGDLGFGWGDGHRLFWYVRAADLRDRRFDRTWATDG